MHIKLAKKIKNKLKKSLILRYINQKLDFLLKKKIPEAFSIINNLKIDTAVDVGSNTGKWTYYLSKVSKNVISFEPTSLLFKLNKKLFSGTKKIKTYNFALGSTNTNTIIKISTASTPTVSATIPSAPRTTPTRSERPAK